MFQSFFHLGADRIPLGSRIRLGLTGVFAGFILKALILWDFTSLSLIRHLGKMTPWLNQLHRIRYEELKDQIKWQEIEGIKIPVASKEALIKMKKTLRPLDQMDAVFLRKLIIEKSKVKDRPTGI